MEGVSEDVPEGTAVGALVSTRWAATTPYVGTAVGGGLRAG